MNVNNNSRYRDTELKIQKAYGRLAKDMPINRITVSDICREANIHRTTFYGHYEDIIQLNHAVEVDQLNRFIDEFIYSENYSFKSAIKMQLDFYYKNQDVMRKHMQENSNLLETSRTFTGAISNKFSDDYRRIFGCKDETEMKYHQIFFQAGYVNVIRHWILSGCQETTDQIADLIVNIYESAMIDD